MHGIGRKPRIKLVLMPINRYILGQGMATLTSFMRQNGYDIEQQMLPDYHKSIYRKYSLRNHHVPSKKGSRSKKKTFSMKYKRKVIDALSITHIENEMLFFPFNRILDRIIDCMELDKFDLLGFSFYSKWHYIPYMLLARRIKQRYNIPIVFGGPYIKLYHKTLGFSRRRFIDYMVVSDGEAALLELARFIEGTQSLENVPSLKYRSNGKVCINEISSLSHNQTPAPVYLDDVLDSIREPGGRYPVSFGILYQMTKGCIHSCSFCPFRKLSRFEVRDAERAVDDIIKLKKETGISKFRFTDSTFNWNTKYVETFCDLLIRRKAGIIWTAFITPNISKALLLKMKKAGADCLLFGFESGSPTTLNDNMNKPFRIDEAEKCIRYAKEVGLKTVVFFLIGTPHESPENVDETIEIIKRNHASFCYVSVFRFSLCHGTDLFVRSHQHRIRIKGKASRYIPHVYAFDEVGGRNWASKNRRTILDLHRVKAVLKDYGIRHHIFNELGE